MVKRSLVLASALTAAIAQPSVAKVYFKEQFNDEAWNERWTVPSKWKPAEETGAWRWTEGRWHGSDPSNKGLQTSEDSRFYGLIAPLSEPLTQTGDLVLQLTVKHEKKLDCGGAYIKLLGPEVDTDSFGGETPYQIMFGPDICGTSARTHVIFRSEAKGENLLVKEDITKVEKDNLSHVYTLHVKADGTYEVYIDQQSVRSGQLETDFDFLPPKTIPDPAQSKPQDWVEEKRIIDPEKSVKPEGYDDIPEHLPDPDATQPEEWDEDEDGAWEPPLVPNPAYNGPWQPGMMDNPDYKGEWVHPEVPNPEYKTDPLLYRRCKDCTHVGFELWQVKSGTIFDDIIVTDSLSEAQAFAEEGWASWKDEEKAMRDEIIAQEEEERKAEVIERNRKKEAEKAAAAAAAEDKSGDASGDSSEAAPAADADDDEVDLDKDWGKSEL